MACSEGAFLQTVGARILYFLANVIFRIFASQCHNSLIAARQTANNLSPIAKKI